MWYSGCFLLVVLRPLLQADQIDCVAQNACTGVNIVCEGFVACLVTCRGMDSCGGGTITCLDGQDCLIVCSGIGSCRQTIMYCPDGPNICEIRCESKDACDEGGSGPTQIILGNPVGPTKVFCNPQVASCGGCNICETCPVQEDFFCSGGYCSPNETCPLPPAPNPTVTPSEQPSTPPTALPSAIPSALPSTLPTVVPSAVPTHLPSLVPTPDATNVPTALPIPAGTLNPSGQPTTLPSNQPTHQSTYQPTFQPSSFPTSSPSDVPTPQETVLPTQLPTAQETSTPTAGVFDECASSTSGISATIDGSGPTRMPGNGTCNVDLSEGSECEFEFNGESHTLHGYKFADAAIGTCFPNPSGDGEMLSAVVEITSSIEIAEVTFEFTIPHRNNTESDDQIGSNGLRSCVSCVWYDEKKDAWSSDGCKTTNTAGNQTICTCNHLTAFAVLRESTRDCAMYNVLGNTLWLAFMILYILLFIVSLIQLCLIIFADGCKLSLKFGEHMLICVIAICQIVVSATIYFSSELDTSLIYLSFIWAMAYSLTFISYMIVILVWGSLVKTVEKMETIEQGKRHSKVVIGFMFLTVILLIFMMLIAIVSADDETADTIVMAGSCLISTLCFILALGVIINGYRLVTLLISLSTAVGRRAQTDIALRLYNVVAIVSLSIICQSPIPLLSSVAVEVFFLNFTIFQSFYLGLDLISLSAIIYLFYQVIQSEARSKRSTINNTSEAQQIEARRSANSFGKQAKRCGSRVQLASRTYS